MFGHAGHAAALALLVCSLTSTNTEVPLSGAPCQGLEEPGTGRWPGKAHDTTGRQRRASWAQMLGWPLSPMPEPHTGLPMGSPCLA